MEKADNNIKKSRIGYRFLFDSKGCSISNRKEFVTCFKLSNKYDIQLYFGPKPLHGIQLVSEGSKYLVPGCKGSFGSIEFKSEVDQDCKYGPFFTEVVASTEINDKMRTTDNNSLLRLAANKKGQFSDAINLVAGVIGLRFQRQFVMELINENPLAWNMGTPVKSYSGPVLENLESVKLNNNGIIELTNLKTPFASLTYENIQKYGLIFHWILRAWNERDCLYRFINLFIPLEILLNINNETKVSNEDKLIRKSIRILINKHADAKKDELLSFFDKRIKHANPSLNEKFIEFAETVKLPGWEGDITAFKRFNKMRNNLLHGSGRNVNHQISIGEEEVRTLADLVERYANFFFFKDNNVYQSRWRPQISEKT